MIYTSDDPVPNDLVKGHQRNMLICFTQCTVIGKQILLNC